jgi:hypothetical protein
LFSANFTQKSVLAARGFYFEILTSSKENESQKSSSSEFCTIFPVLRYTGRFSTSILSHNSRANCGTVRKVVDISDKILVTLDS